MPPYTLWAREKKLSPSPTYPPCKPSKRSWTFSALISTLPLPGKMHSWSCAKTFSTTIASYNSKRFFSAAKSVAMRLLRRTSTTTAPKDGPRTTTKWNTYVGGGWSRMSLDFRTKDHDSRYVQTSGNAGCSLGLRLALPNIHYKGPDFRPCLGSQQSMYRSSIHQNWAEPTCQNY